MNEPNPSVPHWLGAPVPPQPRGAAVKSIGRVGALAVALGAGGVIAISAAGAAAAAPADPGSASNASASADGSADPRGRTNPARATPARKLPPHSPSGTLRSGRQQAGADTTAPRRTHGTTARIGVLRPSVQLSTPAKTGPEPTQPLAVSLTGAAAAASSTAVADSPRAVAGSRTRPRAGLSIFGPIGQEIAYTLFNRSPRLNPTQTGQSPSGVVTGVLNGQDFQGRSLTYGGSGATPKGFVVVDPTTGAYTYTPNPEFAASGGIDYFFATANNTDAYRLPGLAGRIQDAIHRTAQFLGMAQSDTTKKAVAVTVVVNGPNLIDVVGIPGDPSGQPVFSADGKRAYQTTTSYDSATNTRRTTVAVIDTTTGTLIGAPVTVVGERLGALLFSKDGTRAVQTIQFDETTHTVVVIDTATGGLVGSPITISGQQAAGLLQITTDGTRALQPTKEYDDATRTWSTTVTVIDTATGAAINGPVIKGSAFGSPLPRTQEVVQFSADGKRAYLTTTSIDVDTAILDLQSRVAVIDTLTGALVATPVTVEGAPTGALAISPDGSRLYRVTTIPASDGTSTAVVGVIDASTGALVAATTLNGYAVADARVPSAVTAVLFAPNGGSRAFLTTDIYDPSTPTDRAQVWMFDTAAGTLIAPVATIDGQARQPLQWSAADPTHLYQTTVHYGTGTDPDATTIAVLSAIDGSLVGTAVTIGADDKNRPLVFNTAGSRAFLVTTDMVAGRKRVYIAEVDTASGALIGTPTAVDGDPVGTLQLGSTGRYAYQLVHVDAGTPDARTDVAVFDSETGALVNTISKSGAPVGVLQFSADRSRAFLTTGTGLSVVDTTTGSPIANFTFASQPVGSVVFSPDGAHAYHATTAGGQTTVNVYRVETGAKIGNWKVLTGTALSAPILGSEGSRAYVTTSIYNSTAGGWQTQVVEVDTAVGQVVGSPVSLSGTQRALPWLNADGTRLLQTISVYNSSSAAWETGVAVIQTGAGGVAG